MLARQALFHIALRRTTSWLGSVIHSWKPSISGEYPGSSATSIAAGATLAPGHFQNTWEIQPAHSALVDRGGDRNDHRSAGAGKYMQRARDRQSSPIVAMLTPDLFWPGRHPAFPPPT